MEYKNIFQINKNTKCIDDKNILRLINKNFDLEPNIKIQFLKSVCVDLIIGFSMNIDYIEVKLGENTMRIDKIIGIKLQVQTGDKIKFIPKKSNTPYEIYLNIVDIKFENLSKSKINIVNIESYDMDISTSGETQLDFYPISNSNIKSNQINNNLLFDGIKNIIIITTKFIQSIGDYFKIIFEHRGIKCVIKYSLEIKDCMMTYNSSHTLFLIMFNNSTHFLLPNKFIFYQIEQLGSVFLTNVQFMTKLKHSCLKAEQVWEYSSITSKLYSKYCIRELKYIPMPFVLNHKLFENNLDWDKLDYDIFFYGNKNIRREKILNKLNKYFKIKICWGVYGEKKIEYITRSKLILNLHYYIKAGLETCRFNEILNYNKIIISENSLLDKQNMSLYNNIIVMVDNIDEDLSNINKLIDYIKYFLIYCNYKKKQNENKILIYELEKQINKYF